MNKKNIMVIDDNVTNLNIARKVLEGSYNVTLIPKSENAIEKILIVAPDLILLDVEMPVLNGFELIVKIKELGSIFNQIPIIFLTSITDTASEFKGFDLGAVDYIHKPFSPPLLLKRVELHLKLDTQRKQLTEYSKMLEKMSFSDTLTDVYNRNFYSLYIDEFKILPNNKVGVIFADVNGLKVTNDTNGHEVGDNLIKDVAMVLKSTLDGKIFRIGGDEFVCIFENISKIQFNSILDNLKLNMENSDNFSFTIGCVWRENFDNIENVIKDADNEMYKNKQKFYEIYNKSSSK